MGDYKYVYSFQLDYVNLLQGGYLRGRIRLPPSAATATDYYLELSLVYGLDNMDDINPHKITPCLIYLKGMLAKPISLHAARTPLYHVRR